MAPLGCDVDELLEAYLALLDERDRLAVNAARWRAMIRRSITRSDGETTPR
jgi:hypothetical protein